MVVHRVLFVCSQNVCRSPYLATAFANRLAADSQTSFASMSRGTHVRGVLPMCMIADERLVKSSQPSVKRMVHSSRQLIKRDIDRAELILTAGIAERSEVARLDPGARSRTFTVREAHLLSERPLSPDERARVTSSDLLAWAEVMNARRGTLELPETTKKHRRLRHEEAVSPLDIPDSHVQSRAAHLRLFVELDDHVDALATRIADGLRAT